MFSSSFFLPVEKMENQVPKLLKLKANEQGETQSVATKNILHPVDEPQASFLGSCSPLEKKTGMESMLPALLGTHLNIPGGYTFKTRKQHVLLEQNYAPHPVGGSSAAVPTHLNVHKLQVSLSPLLEKRKWMNECLL